jgi:hypothetical protein
VISKLSYYTGLGKEYLSRANMRVKEMQFLQGALRRDDLKVVGRIDSRYTGSFAGSAGRVCTKLIRKADAISALHSPLSSMNYYYG